MKLVLPALIAWLVLLAMPAYAQDLDKGLKAYQANDFATALREWQPLAEAGSAAAAHNLGVMYENGQGVAQDFAVAAKWYRQAAEQGYAAAQTNLGSLYWYGRGVPQDYPAAAGWYRKAVEQDDAQAQFNIGIMYQRGVEAPKDLAEAAKWWRLAAAQGHAGAQQKLAELPDNAADESAEVPSSKPDDAANDAATLKAQKFAMGRAAARAGNYASAYQEWLPLANGGHVEAQFNIGALNEAGLGILKSMVAAAHWYGLAAENGHAKAQYNLAILYLDGRGVKRDTKRAVDLLRRAAQQNHAKAQYNLAVLYKSGHGVRKDKEIANYLFSQAKVNGVAAPDKDDENRAAGAKQTNPAGAGSAKGQPVAASSWRTQCSNATCRTYVTTTYPFDSPDYQKFYLPVLEITPENDIVFAGLYARQLHDRLYGSYSPTELVHNNSEYVATTYFSATSGVKYVLHVDGRKVANFDQIDTGHLRAKASKLILKSFRNGKTVEIRPSINGFFTYTFSLDGFSAAHKARAALQAPLSQ